MKIKSATLVLVALILFSIVSVEGQEATDNTQTGNDAAKADFALKIEMRTDDSNGNFDNTQGDSLNGANPEIEIYQIDIPDYEDEPQVADNNVQSNDKEIPSTESISDSDNQEHSNNGSKPQEPNEEIKANDNQETAISPKEKQANKNDESENDKHAANDIEQKNQPETQNSDLKVEDNQMESPKQTENTGSSSSDTQQENQNTNQANLQIETTNTSSEDSQDESQNNHQSNQQTDQISTKTQSSSQEENQNVNQNDLHYTQNVIITSHSNNQTSVEEDTTNEPKESNSNSESNSDQTGSNTDAALPNREEAQNPEHPSNQQINHDAAADVIVENSTSNNQDIQSNSNPDNSKQEDKSSESGSPQIQNSEIKENEKDSPQSDPISQESINTDDQSTSFQQEPDQLSLEVLDENDYSNEPHSSHQTSQDQIKHPEEKSKVEKPANTEKPHPNKETNQKQEDPLQDSFIAKTNAWFSPDFRHTMQSFYNFQEKYFVEYVIPFYFQVKKSPILTVVAFLISIIYITKAVKGFFSLFSGTSNAIENKGKPMPKNDILQKLNEFSKEIEAIRASLPKQKGSSKQVATSIDPQKINNLSQRLTKNEENLSKLFKENKQLNTYLGSFQKEIVDSHKEIWKELHTLGTSTKSTKADPSIINSGDQKAALNRSTNDP